MNTNILRFFGEFVWNIVQFKTKIIPFQFFFSKNAIEQLKIFKTTLKNKLLDLENKELKGIKSISSLVQI